MKKLKLKKTVIQDLVFCALAAFGGSLCLADVFTPAALIAVGITSFAGLFVTLQLTRYQD